MRRGPTVFIALIALLPFTTTASAQTHAPAERTHMTVIAAPAAALLLSPDAVVARVMSFDRDHDGHVTKEELPDRMHNLLPYPDGGSLDSDTVRLRAAKAAAATTVTGRGFQGSGGYTFGDQVGFSTRSHVEGALDDLRLSASTRGEALAVIRPFMDTLEADASATLLMEMQGLLTDPQVASFRTALDRQLTGRGGAAFFKKVDGTTVQFFMGGMDLAQRVTAFGLPADQHRQALGAVERFKTQMGPGEAERTALSDQLKGILSDEERDDFRAALARRPLVKSGLPGMAGVVSGAVEVHRLVEQAERLRQVVPDGAINNALFIMPKTATPAPQLP
jgi:hypothetical protein